VENSGVLSEVGVRPRLWKTLFRSLGPRVISDKLISFAWLGEDGDLQVLQCIPRGVSTDAFFQIGSADPPIVWLVRHSLFSPLLHLDLTHTQRSTAWVSSQLSRTGQRPGPSTTGVSGHVLLSLLSLVA
jgi:hypothetical protein